MVGGSKCERGKEGKEEEEEGKRRGKEEERRSPVTRLSQRVTYLCRELIELARAP